jgi:hypothetical protein
LVPRPEAISEAEGIRGISLKSGTGFEHIRTSGTLSSSDVEDDLENDDCAEIRRFELDMFKDLRIQEEYRYSRAGATSGMRARPLLR